MGNGPARIAALLCVLAVCPVASAQSDPSAQERQAARALADKGLELFEAGKWEEAFDRFKRAELVIHAPPHLLYMARAQEKLGKLLEAQRLYEQIVADKLPADAPKVFKQAQESAKTEGAAVAAKIPKIVVVLPAERVAEAKVTIDGVLVESGASGNPIPVDPGERRVRIEEPGRAVTRTVVAKPGATERIEIDVGAAEPTTPPPPSPDQPDDAPSPGGGSTLPAIVAFGVGGAGLAVGAITGLLAFSRAGELKDACPKNPCPAKNEELADSSRTFGTISTIGFVVGGVGVAAGVAILVLRPFDSKAPQATGAGQAPRVSLDAGPGWLGMRGAW